MGFNFPNAPTVGQLYPSPAIAGSPVWKWNGSAWVTVGGQGSTAGIYISDTAPTGAPDGAEWWQSSTGLLYIRYNDGDSSQWTMAMPVADATRYAVRFDIAQTLTALQKTQARDNIGVLKKNYVLNGAMQISQENGATAGTTALYYPVDQFFVSFSGTTGTLSMAQVASTTAAGSPNRLRITVTVADAAVAIGDIVYIEQRIEGLRTADLAFGTATAKTIILQFGVKAPAGTYCVVFENSASNRSYVAEYVIAAGEINTDTIKSVTIPGDVPGTWPKDTGLGLRIRWGLMAGSTFQQAAGSWGTGDVVGSSNQFNFMGTATPPNNVFELFDVGLYEGTVAPAFVVPDYGSELALCKRYYEVDAIGTVFSGNVTSGNLYYTVSKFSVEKRAVPNMALTNASSISFPGASGAVATGTQSFYESRTANATNPGLFISSWKANARL